MRGMPVIAVLTLALALAAPAGAGAVTCPDPGTIIIAADNRSADGSVSMAVSGERVASAGECDVMGTAFATSYATTLPCSGSGVVKCGTVSGLAPGLWVHRMSLQVAGSAVQVQAMRALVVGGPAATNVVPWTVFGRTFVVAQASGVDLVAALDAAAAYTGGHATRPALVRFDRTAFPGAALPQTIGVKHHVVQPGNQHVCESDDTCSDGRKTAYCIEAARVTVDAIDDDGLPGGVALEVGTCQRSLFRMVGSDNVLRGLALRGSTNGAPSIPVDTIAIAGASALRNRLEQCTVVGPTDGDGLSVEADAGQPDGSAAPENVLVASEVSGAEDKGVKVVDGGALRLERSCVHDNRNGGIQLTKSNPQATRGGTAIAIENVVQHNVGGDAQNGFFAGVPEDASVRHSLTTRGNVVRFNGARGISVVNAADATLVSDLVSDNYRAGLRVESTRPGIHPSLSVRGAGLFCNYASGLCQEDMTQPCRVDADCTTMCVPGAGSPLVVDGVGAALDFCQPGCQAPTVDLGLGGSDVGRNGFALNANPDANVPGGINLSTTLVLASSVPAAGNQWEHCDVPVPDPVNDKKCNVSQVAALDVRVGNGATTVALGSPSGPRHGPNPVLSSISPARPRAGEVVRVYGGTFNAIDDAACEPAGLPGDACAAENPAVVAANANDVAHGNTVAVTIGGVEFAADVHQVTPTMLMFTMPVDCFAPAVLTVSRGSDPSAPLVICDPVGCGDRALGAVCDDADACTASDACQADGSCLGTPRSCDDANPCTLDGCEPAAGCTHTLRADGETCIVADLCVAPGTCAAGVCDAADPISCDDGHACTDDDCEASVGCRHTLRTELAGVSCHVQQLRDLTEALAFTSAKAAKRIAARIGCIEHKVDGAGNAAPGSKSRSRLAKKALKCVDRFQKRVRKVPDVDTTTREGFLAEGSATRGAISTFFGVP
jgi:hypothetical protein